MSNRVRMLFRGPSGAVYMGNRALKALENFFQFSQAPPRRQWIRASEYLSAAHGMVYNKREDPFGRISFQIDAPIQKIVPVSVPKEVREGSKVAFAKWLWEHIPTNHQAKASLALVREHRGANWRQSMANPVRRGWALKKAKAAYGAQLPSWAAIAGGIMWGNASTVASYMDEPPNQVVIESDGAVTQAPAKPKKSPYVHVPKPKPPKPQQAEAPKSKLKIGVWQ